MDLAKRNSLFFLLALDGVVNVDIGLNSKLLQILIELTDSVAYLRCCRIELPAQLRLVHLHLLVFEVLLTSDILGSNRLVRFPVFMAFLLPFFHEFLILPKFIAVISALSLLNRFDQILFLITLSKSSFISVFHSDFKPYVMSVDHFLITRPDILSLLSPWLDTPSLVIYSLHSFIDFPLNNANLKPSHRLCFKFVRGWSLTLLNSELELVEQA